MALVLALLLLPLTASSEWMNIATNELRSIARMEEVTGLRPSYEEKKFQIGQLKKIHSLRRRARGRVPSPALPDSFFIDRIVEQLEGQIRDLGKRMSKVDRKGMEDFLRRTQWWKDAGPRVFLPRNNDHEPLRRAPNR